MPVITVPENSRAFRKMWEVICNIPVGKEFTYRYDIEPISDRIMSEYASKTRQLAWDSCRLYGLETRQLTRISLGSYRWAVPVE